MDMEGRGHSPDVGWTPMQLAGLSLDVYYGAARSGAGFAEITVRRPDEGSCQTCWAGPVSIASSAETKDSRFVEQDDLLMQATALRAIAGPGGRKSQKRGTGEAENDVRAAGTSCPAGIRARWSNRKNCRHSESEKTECALRS